MIRRKSLQRKLHVASTFLAILAVLVSGVPVQAANFTWNGTTSGVWSNGLNWLGGNAPPSNDASTKLTFGGTATPTYRTTNDFAGNFLINELILSRSGVLADKPNVIVGGTLEFVNDGADDPILRQSGTGAWTILSDIVLTNNLTYTGSGGAGGPITIGSFGGPYSISGPGDLILNKGTGSTLVLYGNNTHAGTVIQSGIVGVGNAGALGIGTVTMSGGTLFATNPIQPIMNDFVLENNVTLGVTTNTSSLVIGGNVDLGGTRTITTATSQTFINGVISNGALNKQGTGFLALGGQNTYVGATTISAGTLRVLAGATVGSNTTSSTIRLNAGTFLRLADAGNVGNLQAITVTSSATSYGVIGLGFDADPNTLGVSLTTTNGGVIALDGIHNYSTNLNLGAIGTGTGAGNYYLGATSFGGTFTGTELTAGNGNNYRLGGGLGTLTIANANVLTGNNNLIVGAPNATAITNTAGRVVILSEQSFTGNVTVGNGGTFIVGQNAALGDASNAITLFSGVLDLRVSGSHNQFISEYAGRDITVSASSGLRGDVLGGGSFNFIDIGNLNVAGAFTLTVTNTANMSFRVTGGTTINGNTTFTTQTTSGLFLTGGIQGGAVNVTKAGAGVLAIGGQSSYTGVTTLSAGTLRVTDVNGLSSNTLNITGGTLDLRNEGTMDGDTVTYSVGSVGGINLTNAATINVGGLTGTFKGNTIALTGDFTINTATTAATLTVANAPSVLAGALTPENYLSGSGYRLRLQNVFLDAATTTFNTTSSHLEIAGLLTGSGVLVKDGRGSMRLLADNTSGFSGDVQINRGSLLVGNSNALGSGTSPVLIGSTSTTTLMNSALLTEGSVSVARNITVRAPGAGGSGIVALGGSDASNSTFSGNIVLGRETQLQAVLGGAVTFSGQMSENVAGTGVAKVGRGTVYLTNANIFSGTLRVNTGELVGYTQPAGSPFGMNNSIQLQGGVIRLVNELPSTPMAAVHNTLTISGGTKLVVDASGGSLTMFMFNDLVRVGAGTLNVDGATNSFGVDELVSFNTISTNFGIVDPWVLSQNGPNNIGNFLTVDFANNLAVASALYQYGGGDINNALPFDTFVVDAASTVTTLAGDVATSNLKVDDGRTVTATGQVLTINGGGIPAGLILNPDTTNLAVGASILGGTLNFNASEGIVYVGGTDGSGATLETVATISANITGTGGLTKFGPGTLVLAGTDNNLTGQVSVNAGVLRAGAENIITTGMLNGAFTGTGLFIDNRGTFDAGGFDQKSGALSGDGTLVIDGVTFVTGLNNAAATFSGQILGAGGTLVKAGTGTMTISNTNGLTPNELGTVRVDRGTLIIVGENSTGGSPTPVANAINSDALIVLRGGTLQLRHDGDFGTGAQNVVFGNDVRVTGGNAILNVQRITAAPTNTTVELGSLSIGDNSLQTTGTNTYNVMFRGTTTLSGQARVDVSSAQLVLDGKVTDDGRGFTLNKIGGSTLLLNSPDNDYSGGTVVTGGSLLFGTLVGNTFVPNSAAKAGTGHIVVQAASAIRFNSPDNLYAAAGQEVRVLSSINSKSRIDLQFDGGPDAINLRTLGTGVLSYNAGGGFIHTALNMSMIGDGTWQLGAVGTSTYAAEWLGAGKNGEYRLGGGGSTMVFSQANVMNGTVRVGAPLLVNGTIQANTTGTVILQRDQELLGNIVVNRGVAGTTTAANGNTLDFRGRLSSPVIDVAGNLLAVGAGRFTDDNGINVNTVILRPGALLRLDYNAGVGDTIGVSQISSAIGTTNKWQDDLPIDLNGASLDILSGSSLTLSEAVGTITLSGGADIQVRRTNTTSVELVVGGDGLVRNGQATLTVNVTDAANLGNVGANLTQRLIVADPAMAPARGVVNGTTVNMVAPWMINRTALSFLDYNPDTSSGFSNAAFTVTSSTGTFNAGANNGTDIVITGTTAAQTISGTADVYALRVGGVNNSAISGGTLRLRSGGLITTTTTNNISSNVYFGDGTTPVEAVIFTTTSSSLTLSGQITAENLTKFGPGNLTIAGGNNNITGNIQVNGGLLQIFDTTATNSTNAIGNSQITLYGSNLASATLNLRFAGTQAGLVTLNNDIVLGRDTPIATISIDRTGGTVTNAVIVVPSLTFNTNDTIGQTLVINHGNDWDFRVSGPTVINSTGIGPGMVTIATNTASGTLAVTLSGAISGNGRLIKAGNGLLELEGANTYSGGTEINNGTLRLRQTDANAALTAAGTGEIVINSGTLSTLFNGTASFIQQAGNNLTINGNSTISADRTAGTGAVTHNWGTSANVMTINNVTLTLSSGQAGSVVVWNGTTQIKGGVNIVDTSAILRFLGSVGDVAGAGGSFINKVGTQRLDFQAATLNTFAGGLVVSQGMVRAANANTNFGMGGVIVNPGGGITMVNANNILNTAGGVTRFQSNASALAVFGIGFNTTQATLSGTLLPTARVLSQNNAGGVLAVDGNLTTTAIDLATLYDGHWYLGSSIGGTYSATTLGAGAGNTYRLGGGGSTLTISSNVLVDGTGTLSGTRVVYGKAFAANGNGTVTIGLGGTTGTSGTFTYTGDTVISGHVMSNTGALTNAAVNVRRQASPFGIGGTVHVFGTVAFLDSLGSAVNPSGVQGNTYVFNPGAILDLNHNIEFTGSGGQGRWGDSVGIDLNGSTLIVRGRTNSGNVEIVGPISFDRGSNITLTRGAATFVDRVDTESITRISKGTIGINHTSGTLGIDEQLVVSAPNEPVVTNSMVAPYIVSQVQHQFLTYQTPGSGTTSHSGFRLIDTSNASNPNYNEAAAAAAIDSGTLQGNNGGTQILSALGASTLLENLDVYALRINGSMTRSGGDMITIRSGGLIASAAATVNVDFAFGATGGASASDEALIYLASTMTYDGQIHAGSVTKFGAGTLALRNDQNNVLGSWDLNAGVIQVQALGGLGATNEVNLYGGVGNGPILRFQLDTGSPDLAVFTSGKITAWNGNTIHFNPLVADRTAQIADIDLKTTSTEQWGGIRFQVDNSRTTLKTGTMTLFADYVINVDAGSFGFASTSGVDIGLLDNQGQYNAAIVGDGLVILNDNSTSFTNGTLRVDQGAVRVRHDGSLGGVGAVANIDLGGTLEIDVANYNPIGTVNLLPGSAERWTREDARGLGDYVFDPGVSLQLRTDLFAARTITMQGGTIQGYVRTDDDSQAVFRTTASGVNFHLAADSFVGQLLTPNSPFVDIGKVDTQMNLLDPRYNGAILEIKGNISGPGSLTKVGSDTVVLSGSGNSFAGAHVREGTLRIGTDNALPTAGALSLQGSGIFDLNGYDQQVGSLGGLGGSVVNSATTMNTLTVGDASSTTFSGEIKGNLDLWKIGSGALTLGFTNTYIGTTTIAGGVLASAIDEALGTGDVLITNGELRLNTFNESLGRVTLFDGAITGSGGTLTTFGVEAHNGLISANLAGNGGLLKDTGGTVNFSGNGSYSGGTTVSAGTLLVNGSLDSGGVVVHSGATLGGSGTILDTVTINAGGALEPGNSVGTLSTGSEIWNSTLSDPMRTTFEIRNAEMTGIPGTDWDLIAITGTLTINADPFNQINLTVESWLPDNSGAGAMANFDPFQSYSWQWVTTTGGITVTSGDPVQDLFAISVGSAFSSAFPVAASGGNFFVSQANDALYINFTAVPEPGSLLLAGLAALGMGGYGWRRRRQPAEQVEAAEQASA